MTKEQMLEKLANAEKEKTLAQAKIDVINDFIAEEEKSMQTNIRELDTTTEAVEDNTF